MQTHRTLKTPYLALVAACSLWACDAPDAPPPDTVRQAIEACGALGCGNGLLEPGETCDDGNAEGGDGCTAACLREIPPIEFEDLVRLRARAFTPEAGIEDSVVAAAQQSLERELLALHAMALLPERPPTGAHEAWLDFGVTLQGRVHEGNWLVKLALDPEQDLHAQLDEKRDLLGATHLVAFEPGDKGTAALVAGDAPDWALDPESGRVTLEVALFPAASAEAADAIIAGFHVAEEPAATPDDHQVAIVAEFDQVGALLAEPEVASVAFGPAPPAPLMDAVRANLGVTRAEQPDLCLTGAGIKVATVGERPSTGHDDFFAYDGVTSRILSGGQVNGTVHGDHVSGMMIGNGVLSATRGGQPYQWRGVAPEALFVDTEYTRTTPLNAERPHVASSSMMTMGFDGNYDLTVEKWDRRVRGDATPGHFHLQLWAAGNNGVGYGGGGQGAGTVTRSNYAIGPSGKNTLAVGNIAAEDSRWAQSSMGPTYDGRIKPDLVAPGCRMRHPYQNPVFEVESVRIERAGGNPDIVWDFDTPNDLQGWQPGLLARTDVDGPYQVASPGGFATRWTLLPERPDLNWGWHNAPGDPAQPMVEHFDGTLGGPGAAADEMVVRYRYVGGVPMWDHGRVRFFSIAPGSVVYETFEVRADGGWHDLVIPLGTMPGYVGREIERFRLGPYAWNPGSIVATNPDDQYGESCGTSMASPAATGALALVLEELTRNFSIDLDTLGPSPFAWGSPGFGRPLPSTLKALMIHSARDLARVARATDQAGADTGAPPEYHKGPDFTTGYGAVDAAEAVRLVQLQVTGEVQILERDANGVHDYVFDVSPGDTAPLKATLAWSDEPSTPGGVEHERKLINDLGLVLVSPTGQKFYPWSIELPYVPNGCANCPPPEVDGDEPLDPTDFVPARRDGDNTLDNVEMVLVETPEPGQWTVKVRAPSLPLGPQPYSLIIGQPAPPSDALEGGKVAFVSDRTSPAQVWVKINDGSGAPATAMPNWGSEARDPEWSPDGRFLAYLLYDALGGADSIIIRDTQGQQHQQFVGPFVGFEFMSNISWSRDGSEILVSYYNQPETRGIGAVDSSFGWPRTLIAPGAGPWSPDGPVHAGPDPSGVDQVIVHVDSACPEDGLFRLPYAGGAMEPLWADGFPSQRARMASVSPDGQRVLYASTDHLAGIAGFQDGEVVELTRFEGVTTRRTGQPGDQAASYAIGGAGEWIAETNTAVGDDRELLIQQNGRQLALDVDDPGNQFDDHHPSWWKADPNAPRPDPNAPSLGCTPIINVAPSTWPNCGPYTPPPVPAASVCGVDVEVTADPDVLVGDGPHEVTYTAVDTLGNVSTCQSLITYTCNGRPQ